MKSSVQAIATIFVSILLLTTSAAETAPVKFISSSVIITPATGDDDPLFEKSSVSSFESGGINNELMLSGSDYSHEAYFIFEDLFGDEYSVPFLLDIPPYKDENSNGIHDFFDVDMSVDSIETEGVHGTEEGGAEFYVTWSREAGEVLGGVSIQFPYFGMTFDHLFYLNHYVGEFSYERSGTALQGTLALTNTWFTDQEIRGPLSVRVVNARTLDLTATTWTATGGQMVVDDEVYDNVYGTNFVSYWLLEDGNPGTPEAPDYVDWMMAIGSGDSDNDGVLDLVDTGGGPVNPRPSLAITRTQAGFEISITGTEGETYWLEYASLVTDTAWPEHHVVTLTGPTQVMTVPATTGNVYFRLREI